MLYSGWTLRILSEQINNELSQGAAIWTAEK